jgi:hypothetical protein
MNAKVRSLEEFLLVVRNLRRKWRMRRDQELWFRAEDIAHHKTRLQPGLYRPRIDARMHKPVQKLLALENRLYEECRRCAAQLSPSDVGSIDDEWDSYFLMQHHGVPTRLLDWSDGALISLDFAVRDKQIAPKNGSIIYILNPYWLLKRLERSPDRKSAEKRWKDYWEKKRPYDTDDEDSDRLYLPFGADNPDEPLLNMPALPILWDSPHMTRRIAAQRSRFMIFGTDSSFLTDLESEKDSRLVSVTIPRGAIHRIRQELRDAGISESVVYPDLDGLGRELKQEWEHER